MSLAKHVPGFDVPRAHGQDVHPIMSASHGLYAAAGTPPEVRQRLATAIRAALREEGLNQRCAKTPTTMAPEDEATPAHHARSLAREIGRLRPLILAAGQFAD